jgi:hypothetical protein
MIDKELYLMALSVKSPTSVEEMSAQLARVAKRNGETLLVLPEYYLRGRGEGFDPIGMNDGKVLALEQYALAQRVHVVVGAVLGHGDGSKTLSGLFITPRRGVVFNEVSSKKYPTPREIENGVVPVNSNLRMLHFDDSETRALPVSCFDLWKGDIKIRKQMEVWDDDRPQIIAHMRGFDLENPDYGSFARNWSRHFSDVCMMTKSYGIAATGVEVSGRGSISEMIDPVLGLRFYCDGGLVVARADLEWLDQYRKGQITSGLVPKF